MSDTPQTNSIAYKGYNESAYIAEMTDLARTLERELATLTADFQKLTLIAAQLRVQLDKREPRSITTQNKRHIARLELQRDRLRVEVKRLNDLVKDMLK